MPKFVLARIFQSNPLMLSEPGGSMWGSRGQLPHRNEPSRISEFVQERP